MSKGIDARALLLRTDPELLQALRLQRLFSRIADRAQRARVIKLTETILRAQEDHSGAPRLSPRR